MTSFYYDKHLMSRVRQVLFSPFYRIGSSVLSNDCSSFTFAVSLKAYFLGKLVGKKRGVSLLYKEGEHFQQSLELKL